jgi:hypothetical protein
MVFKFMMKKFLNMQLRESHKFLENLKVVDCNEIGFTVALATHFRNEWREKGIDVSDPIVAHSLNPSLVIDIIKEIRSLQRSGGEALASGLMVWVHSLRAANDLKLRETARNIWGELERGFPFVEQAQIEARHFIKTPLDITGYDQFPKGLTPKPI